MKAVLKISLSALVVIFISGCIFLRATYGGGSHYPDLSTPAVIPNDSVEVFFEYDEPLGNIAVSADNRVFFTVHPESRPGNHRLMEIIDGVATPYPDAELQKEYFHTVLGVVIDQKNRLWTIDHGFHGFGSTKLLAFDLTTNEIVYEHVFGRDIAQLGSFFNDLQVSNDGRYVYIADLSFFRKNPALVVHDTQSGQSKRLLEGQHAVTAQDYIIRTDIKEMVFFGLVTLQPGIDGIALGVNGEYIYFGAMTHDKLYRIKTSLLNSLTHIADSDIEEVGTKPLSDGLSIDSLGNVYITDVEHNGIAMMTPQGHLHTEVRDHRIRWADGLSFGSDGYLYITDSGLPDQMMRSKSHISSRAPYRIFKYCPTSAGVAGR